MSNFVESLCLVALLSLVRQLIMNAALKLFKSARFSFEFFFNIDEMVFQISYNQ